MKLLLLEASGDTDFVRLQPGSVCVLFPLDCLMHQSGRSVWPAIECALYYSPLWLELRFAVVSAKSEMAVYQVPKVHTDFVLCCQLDALLISAAGVQRVPFCPLLLQPMPAK